MALPLGRDAKCMRGLVRALFSRMQRRRGDLVTALALVALVVTIAVVRDRYIETMPRGDVLYEAIVAKSLLAGEGLSTNLMPLGALRTLLRLDLADAPSWPSLHKFVLSQVRIAAFGAVLGIDERTLRISSFVSYVGLVLATFVIMRRLLASRLLAFAFTLVLVSYNELFFVAISGLGLSTDALLFLGTLVLASRVREQPRLAIWVGVVLAATVLHRYSMGAWVPFCVAAVAWSCGYRVAARVLGACLAVLAPFVAWSYARFGMPFPSYLGDALFLHNTRFLPYDPWYCRTWESLATAIAAAPSVFVAKAGVNARLVLHDLGAGPAVALRNVGIVVLGVLGVRRLFRTHTGAAHLAVAGLVFAAAFTAYHLFCGFSSWYFQFLVPPALLLAASGAKELVSLAGDRRRLAERAAPAVALALALPNLADAYGEYQWFRVLGPKAVRAERDCAKGARCVSDDVIAHLRDAYAGSHKLVMAGNTPWELAFELPHRFIPVLEAPEDLLRLREHRLVPDLLVVPPDLTFAGHGARPPGWRRWKALVDAHPPRFVDYELRHVFPDGGVLYERNPTLDVSGPIALCAPEIRMDLRRRGDFIHFESGFETVDEYEGRAWTWMRAEHGTIAFVPPCAARESGARLRVAYAPAASHPVRVRVGGHDVGTLAADAFAWQEAELFVPPEAFVAEETRLELISDLPDKGIAIERIELAPGRRDP